MGTKKDKRKESPPRKGKKPVPSTKTICANRECRLRKAGCKGFEGCPGYLKK